MKAHNIEKDKTFNEATDNRWEVHDFVSIAFTAAGGFVISGISGSVLGLTVSVADTIMISNGYYNKHYFSSGAYWGLVAAKPLADTFATYFPQYSGPIYAAGAAVASFMTYNVDDFFSFQKKLEIPLQSFLTINKMFDKSDIISEREANRIYTAMTKDPTEALSIIYEDARELYNNEFFSNFLTIHAASYASLLQNHYILKLLGSYTHVPFAINVLNAVQTTSAAAIAFEGGKILSILISDGIFSYLLKTQQQKLHQDQEKLITEKANQLIFKDAQKIMDHDNGEKLIHKLENDFVSLVFDGTNSINAIISETGQVLFSLSNLNGALDFILPRSLAIIPYQFYLREHASSLTDITKTLNHQLYKKSNYFWDMQKNIASIHLRDGKNFVEHKLDALSQNITTLKSDLKIAQFNTFALDSTVGYFKEVVNLGYFAMKQIYGTLADINPYLILKAMPHINRFIVSNILLEIDQISLISAIERVNKVFTIISQPYQTELIRANNSEGKIIFQDYNLTLPNKYVHIPYLEFKPAKHYAIMGQSGCGKTSTLIDMKIGVSGGLHSKGYLSIPQNSKIMFINQDLYQPYDTSLLEVIYFPKLLHHLSEEKIIQLKDFIIYLMDALALDNGSFDEDSGLKSNLNSTDFVLSGGQVKKVAIIQAIITKPDILIMDESFAGLDAESITIVQRLLSEYLPNTTILCVDHEAKQHNDTGFYDYVVNFYNNTVKLQLLDNEDLPVDVSAAVLSIADLDYAHDGFNNDVLLDYYSVVLGYCLDSEG
jgi:ABC-type uncharacterized transport system fused permease/ATPase subunit